MSRSRICGRRGTIARTRGNGVPDGGEALQVRGDGESLVGTHAFGAKAWHVFTQHSPLIVHTDQDRVLDGRRIPGIHSGVRIGREVRAITQCSLRGRRLSGKDPIASILRLVTFRAIPQLYCDESLRRARICTERRAARVAPPPPPCPQLNGRSASRYIAWVRAWRIIAPRHAPARSLEQRRSDRPARPEDTSSVCCGSKGRRPGPSSRWGTRSPPGPAKAE